MPIPALLAGAAKAAPAVLTGLNMLFGRPRRKKGGVGSVVAKYLNRRADGYVTDADKEAANRVTQRVARQAGSQRRDDTQAATNRMARTGGLGSGLFERALQQIADREAVGLENAGLAGADAEYGAYNRNKGFEENKTYQAMAAETRAAEGQAARDDAASSTFWNSNLDVLQQLGSIYPAAKPAAGATAVGAPGARAVDAAMPRQSLALPRLRSDGGRPMLNYAPAPPRVGRRVVGALRRNAGQFAYSG